MVNVGGDVAKFFNHQTRTCICRLCNSVICRIVNSHFSLGLSYIYFVMYSFFLLLYYIHRTPYIIEYSIGLLFLKKKYFCFEK